MLNKLFAFCIILFTFNASAQECNCLESFDWMVNTFEKNDAGFQYVIDKKGQENYQKHTLLIREKIKNISNLKNCQAAMMDWLLYFRPGHVGVLIKQDTISSHTAIEKNKNEETFELTENQLIHLLEKKPNRNSIEGIWSNNNYTIGIIADEKSDKEFTAFIIKSSNSNWRPKQVKAEFKLNEDNKTYSVDYYMGDHSKQNDQAYFINDSFSILSLYKNYWIRNYPPYTIQKKEETLLKFSNSYSPFIEKLSDQTLYLRIPSFSYDQKVGIDSVLAKYDNVIKNTPNLIIDIRNGTGGADDSYANIIPYLYTNPIKYTGIQFYATELNAQAYEKYAGRYDASDTVDINECLNIAAKMRANLGKYIDVSSLPYDIDSSYKVLPYPQKIAIICNKHNGSSDEQFLLDAKQSRKVKIFGIPTGGMLDISNMNLLDFPDGKFVLAYCMTKSYRIPNFCIDGVGVQPDYFIDDAILEADWIEYTKTVLEQ